MNQQIPNGQQANVAIIQTRQSGGQNNEQSGTNPHPAGEVDWREDMFQKITSLKDAHWSELMDFGRVLHSCVLRMKANGEQAAQYKYTQHIMESIIRVLRFLRIQKTNIPEAAKDKLDMWQNAIRDLLCCYSAIKARKAVMLRRMPRLQSQVCREPPHVLNTSCATDNSQQNHCEQHALAEALSHSSQDAPSETPLIREQDHADNLAGEAEDNTVLR
jgi:hypothetical protein